MVYDPTARDFPLKTPAFDVGPSARSFALVILDVSLRESSGRFGRGREGGMGGVMSVCLAAIQLRFDKD